MLMGSRSPSLGVAHPLGSNTAERHRLDEEINVHLIDCSSTERKLSDEAIDGTLGVRVAFAVRLRTHQRVVGDVQVAKQRQDESVMKSYVGPAMARIVVGHEMNGFQL